MTTQVFPSGFAGTSTDTFVPDNTLLGSEHPTQNYDMPSNTAVVQYEHVKLAGTALVKIAGAPAAGDIVGVVAYAADNLTATAAAARTPKVSVYIRGEFNGANITVPSSTVDAWRAVANGSGIVFCTTLAFLS